MVSCYEEEEESAPRKDSSSPSGYSTGREDEGVSGCKYLPGEQDAHSRNNCALDLTGNRIKERYESVGYGKQMSVRGCGGGENGRKKECSEVRLGLAGDPGGDHSCLSNLIEGLDGVAQRGLDSKGGGERAAADGSS